MAFRTLSTSTNVVIHVTCRRRIDWGRLLVALDVGAPADFTDPDRSFVDDLPQPYRLIVGVLDTEVFSAKLLYKGSSNKRFPIRQSIDWSRLSGIAI